VHAGGTADRHSHGDSRESGGPDGRQETWESDALKPGRQAWESNARRGAPLAARVGFFTKCAVAHFG